MFLNTGPTRPKSLNRPPAAEHGGTGGARLEAQSRPANISRPTRREQIDCFSRSAARAFAPTGFRTQTDTCGTRQEIP